MMRAHQGLRLAILRRQPPPWCCFFVALLAYWWLLPAPAAADSPYATADAGAAQSTAADQWGQGVGALPVPEATPPGPTSPTARPRSPPPGPPPSPWPWLTWPRPVTPSYTPVAFAQWATDHDLTAAGTDTVACVPATGRLRVRPGRRAGGTLTTQTLRRAIVSNVPVLVVTQPGTFAPTTSVVVLDDIDKDSRIVLHDPTSPSRSAKSWAFDDITDAAAARFHGA